MVTMPSKRTSWHEDFGGLVRDAASKELAHPGGYMFRDLPEVDGDKDYPAFLLGEMDRWGIEKAVLPVSVPSGGSRLYGSCMLDPNNGVEAVRTLRRDVADGGAIAASVFPSGTNPQQTIAAALMYPIYAACAELDVPIFLNVGVPGPRFPMETQAVRHLDQVCYDFPDLKILMRHGGEPWEDLAVKLMLKWPNLYYTTSAFAPKYYPSAIVDYANSRGADKVIYAGYFPSGLSLERIMTEMPSVPFKDHVWPKFLRENALRVLGIA